MESQSVSERRKHYSTMAIDKLHSSLSKIRDEEYSLNKWLDAADQEFRITVSISIEKK